MTSAHVFVVREKIVPIAQTLNDPYYTEFKTAIDHAKIESGEIDVIIENKSLGGHDCIKTQTGGRTSGYIGSLIHHYPISEAGSNFINNSLESVRKSLSNALDKNLTIENRLVSLANGYQRITSLRLYKDGVNQSLFMNIVNADLELMGLKSIEHGITDFAAMRLSEENFTAYFLSEIVRVNPQLKKALSLKYTKKINALLNKY